MDFNFPKGYGDRADKGKIDEKRLDRDKMMNSFEEKSYKLARAEKKYQEYTANTKKTLGNRKERYNLKKEYESKLADVVLTIYQLNNKIDEFPPKDRTFIEGLVKAYKKYDTQRLLEKDNPKKE